MKLTALQSDLAQGLTLAARAVSSRNTLPILSGILIKTDTNRLRLSATDLEVALEVEIPAQIEQEGQIVLPARHLTEIVRRVPPAAVQLEVDTANYTALLRWDKSRYTIHGQSPEQFPVLGKPAGPPSLTIAAAELRDIIRHTVFAASHDETRPILTGTCLIRTPGLLEAVATDGVRIAYHRTVLPEDTSAPGEQRLVVPARALNELARLLTPAEGGQVELWLEPNQVYFAYGDVYLASRLLEGQYPDVLRLVPKQYPTTIRTATQDLQAACERAALIAREGSNAIKLSLGDNAAYITSQTPEVGQVYEEVPATLEGSPLEVGLNPRFVTEGLRVIADEELIYEFSGPRTATRMRPASGENFFYVVLPIVVW